MSQEILLLPLDAIEPDPGQPRRLFADDKLEELALNIEKSAGASAEPWIDGLLHPIVVYESPAWVEGMPGPRYRLLAGERRWRTYCLRRWPVIPARLMRAPASDFQLRLTQLNENLGRENTTLWEDAQAIQDALHLWRFEHPAGTAREFAEDLGRSASWVSQHLALTKAEGTLKQALVEGRIRHVEAYRAFAQIDPTLRIEILNRVRRSGEPITLSLARQYLPRGQRLRGVAEAPSATPAESTQSEIESPPPGTPEELSPAVVHAEAPELLALLLAPYQARFVLFSLNHPIPEEDSELMAALNTALAKIPA